MPNTYTQIYIQIIFAVKGRQSTIQRLYNSIKINYLNPPTISEQTRIANFLSALDEKTNRTENQIQQTQQYKKSLLQNMLV